MNVIQLTLKKHIKDVVAARVQRQIAQFLDIAVGEVKYTKVFVIDYPLLEKEIALFAQHCLKDTVANDVYLNTFFSTDNYKSFIAVAKLPGVTDDEGISAQKALNDYLNLQLDTHTQHIFTQDLYYIEKALTKPQLKIIAEELLGNNLIHHFQCDTLSAVQQLTPKKLYTPKVRLLSSNAVETISLDIPDDDLLALSKNMVLALNLPEMKAIQAYYRQPHIQQQRQKRQLPPSPTDCELEVLAQTWSEHCKHKEFNATIAYTNHQTGEQKNVSSLFKTYIKAATDRVQQSLLANGNTWLLKVFADNAGVVRINEHANFVWKVETHNSPSALDPYGGAITGILGNNRDPLGTGIGGAKLLFNTNVLCFASPYYAGKLLTGQLHPKRIFDGVRHGIEAGGNKSGVPTVNGAIVFDDRFRGKPLVYCGTGAIMKPQYPNTLYPTWEKRIDVGDYIIMAGGRVGKDGIHGATFSSVEIDENSPNSAVQIGSPITQKLLSDFLVQACEKGWVKCSTDNGAGGLSSSVGELANLTGGAIVRLQHVPLKYSGLRPWEIFVSESQERMTLVVEPQHWEILRQFAADMEVEVSHIGEFTDSGVLDIWYDSTQVAYLDMAFLHDGVPQKHLIAEWVAPQLAEPQLPHILSYNDILCQLLSSLNICSRENVIRQYDHEVKGRTVIKPLMGAAGKAPQDAAVVRLDFSTYEGIAVSNGIIPRYGDIDAYQMSAGAFDEAARQIIAIGGKLPNTQYADNIFWSVNDNFCVPDSVYHPETNPDGKEKLAKLVQMCEALYDMATFFDIPLTSGKDSMKNDFKADGVKIAVPPTILYSMAAKITDIRKTITSEFKQNGDLVYQLGTTYNELGASEFYRLFDSLGANVPIVRPADAKQLYLRLMQANEQGYVASCHDLSDGGLAVAAAEAAFGGNCGAMLYLQPLLCDGITPVIALFAESHSRFIATVSPQHRKDFEQIMGSYATYLGKVTATPELQIALSPDDTKLLVDLPTSTLLSAWSNGLPQ